jgi:hypothetical protein
MGLMKRLQKKKKSVYVNRNNKEYGANKTENYNAFSPRRMLQEKRGSAPADSKSLHSYRRQEAKEYPPAD